jgi:hypothetical protein
MRAKDDRIAELEMALGQLIKATTLAKAFGGKDLCLVLGEAIEAARKVLK